MPSTIITKNGSGAPLDTDLVAGELAVDLTNGRLYTTDLDTGGTVLELGTNPASDVTFGDNTKAIFGAGSDLQIFHDASDSIINDNGTGSLKLQQGGSTKLEVTATGIDVTGTVTADGLTVDVNSGDAKFIDAGTSASDTPQILIGNGDTSARSGLIRNYNDATNFEIIASASTTADKNLIFRTVDNASESRLKIGNNGDISFYEDTGTTPKFFWDASAESLGIGTSSPSAALDIEGLGNTVAAHIFTSDNVLDATASLVFGTTPGSRSKASIQMVNVNTGNASGALAFSTNGGSSLAEAMRIDSSGNLLVGTTSAWSGETASHIESRGDVAGDYAGVIISNTNDAASDSASLNFGLARDGGLVFGNAGKITVGKEQDWTGTPSTIDSFMSFSTYQNEVSAERMRIDSSGHAIIPAGVTLGTAVGTYNAANTLDDYEAGTFTPTVYSSDNTTVLTSGVDYDLNDYRYVKVGRHVMMEVRIRDLRATKTDIFCTLPFTSTTSDSGVGITAEGDVIYLASNRLNFRKGTNQYPYGIVNFESS